MGQRVNWRGLSIDVPLDVPPDQIVAYEVKAFAAVLGTSEANVKQLQREEAAEVEAARKANRAPNLPDFTPKAASGGDA